MKTQLLKINPKKPEADKLREAASTLKKGGLVVFPTETVYGIGANVKNRNAMLRLRRLKDRPKNPFSFHIGSKSDLKRLDCMLDSRSRVLIRKFWPGPLTLVLNTASGETIGVRMPAHPVALALLKKASVPVVAPSANFRAQMPAITARQAIKDLRGRVDIIIDAGRTKIGVSSTVLDMTCPKPEILRSGAVTKRMIERTIGTKI